MNISEAKMDQNNSSGNHESRMELLQDAQTPHSLQTPPPQLPPPPSSASDDDNNNNNIDLSSLTSQEAADHLFLNSQILAPMVRASTIPLRTQAISHGASLVYTEELVDRSITPTERTLNKKLGTIDYRVPFHTYSKKVQKRMLADKDNPDSKDGAILLRIDPFLERNKLIYQVGTGESNLALEAARKVIQDVNGMDVNMGCPKKFSVSGGMGSALLSDVQRACDIIATLRRNLGSKPVSAKIRLLDPDDPRPTLDFVRALIKAGANAITIHGRIVGDESHTVARWGTLTEVVRQLKQTESVPIIVNGDLYTRADIREMRRRTGCDGVMLARPALYNMSLFRRGEEEKVDCSINEHDECYNKEDEIPLSRFQMTNHKGRYGYDSPLLHNRTSIVQEYLAHCVRYRAHSKNAKYVVCEMMNARRAPTNRVSFLDMRFDGGQTIASVCKCKSLDDLVRVWDVKWSIPMRTSVAATGAGDTIQGDNVGKTIATSNGKDVDALGDLHNYDDRYFLDPDKFRKERTDAVAAALASSKHDNSKGGEDEKKTEDDGCEADSIRDGDGGPTAKRPKI
mmetsp:Transcript_30560/g.66071  ORF Transcript_30560/g.66071 Transcript_30560/m.66071 type:complete len:569 (+) Transcript_30560:279-1985(+)